MVHSFVTRVVAALALALLISLPAAPVAAAGFNLHKGLDCGTASDSAVCKTNSTTDPVTGSNGVIHNVTRIIATMAGAVAIIIIVLAGIKYISSQGEPEEVSRAKKAIIFASVGLVLILLAQAIINVVIGKV